MRAGFQPVVAQSRSRSRSLGTVAIAHQEKQYTIENNNNSSAHHPSWFPPLPPSSTAPIVARRISMRDAAAADDPPRPVDRLPPLPPVPPVPRLPRSLILHAPVPRAPPAPFLAPPSPAFSEDGPRSPLLERVNSKRRTIMSRIEGWWDLNLIEKRQTLFGQKKSNQPAGLI